MGSVPKEVVKEWMENSKSGKVEAMNSLLEKYPEILNQKHGFVGHSALHWAAAKNSIPALKFLLEKSGIEVDIQNNGESTPLHSACNNGMLGSIELLLRNGASLDVCDVGGDTPRVIAEKYAQKDAHVSRTMLDVLDKWAATRRMEGVNVDQMSVKDMKSFLTQHRIEFGDCLEKGDLKRRVKEALEGKAPKSAGIAVRTRSSSTTPSPPTASELGESSPPASSGSHVPPEPVSAAPDVNPTSNVCLGCSRWVKRCVCPTSPTEPDASSSPTKSGRTASREHSAVPKPRVPQNEPSRADMHNFTETLKNMSPEEIANLAGAAGVSPEELKVLASAGCGFSETESTSDSNLRNEESEVPLAANNSSQCHSPSDGESEDDETAGEDKRATAENAKAKGNAEFAAKNFAKAERFYSMAISLFSSDAVYYSNRAAARTALAKWADACQDCDTVIRLRPDWFKGYLRKGTVFATVGDWKTALQAYEAGLQHDPSNSQLLEAAGEARKQLDENRE
eukprot:Rmarinus@m.9377